MKMKGNLGIGTTGPDASLHVVRTGGGSDLKLESTDTSGADIDLLVNGGTDAWRHIAAHNTGKFRIIDEKVSAERVTIDSTGNVGIGTTSPGAKLEVDGTAKIANWAEQSLTPNGYAKIGSLLIQWGVLTNVSLNQTFHSITFPITFPNSIFNLQATIHRGNVISGTVATLVRNLTLTGAQVAGDHDTNTSSGDIHWIAIGY